MAKIKLIKRWAWTPFEELSQHDGSPIVKPTIADYSSKAAGIIIPRSDIRPLALCYVEFLPDQFLAAQQDPRLQILESVHSSRPNTTVMTQQMAEYGLEAGMTTHDILQQMYFALGAEAGYLTEE